MQKLRKFTVALIVVVVLLFVGSFMFTYTVGFTEVGVKTTMGRASEHVDNSDGLKFKIPGIQSVIKYDKRARFKESRPETQQTADNRQVIATAYVTWRISDPKVFYERFSNSGSRPEQHYKTAENDIIEKQLRSALGEISQYRLDDLLSLTTGDSKMTELENKMEHRLNDQLAEQGIAVTSVGLDSLKLPPQVTTAVSERMKQERERIAKQTTEEGKALAEAIRSRADTDASNIISFAQQLAGSIRAQGEVEASQFLAQMNQNPKLAVWLKNLDFIKRGIGERTTLVLTPSTPGFEAFNLNTTAKGKPGEIPSSALTEQFSEMQKNAKPASTEQAPAKAPAGGAEKGEPAAAAPAEGAAKSGAELTSKDGDSR